MRLEELINRHKNFSDTDFLLLEYIMSAKTKVTEMKTSDLAEATFTSPASVTRLAKKLGFSGFNEFKFFLKNDLKEQSATKKASWELLKNDIEQTLNIITDTNLQPFSDLIQNAHKVFVFGTDWGERNAAEFLIRNFLAVGIHMIQIPSVTELRWIAENAHPADLIIIISFSGENKDVTEISQILRLRKTSVISVTPLTKNYLSNLTPYNLYYQTTDLPELGIDPHAEYNFFTPLHILLDALFRNYYDNCYNLD